MLDSYGASLARSQQLSTNEHNHPPTCSRVAHHHKRNYPSISPHSPTKHTQSPRVWFEGLLRHHQRDADAQDDTVWSSRFDTYGTSLARSPPAGGTSCKHKSNHRPSYILNCASYQVQTHFFRVAPRVLIQFTRTRALRVGLDPLFPTSSHTAKSICGRSSNLVAKVGRKRLHPSTLDAIYTYKAALFGNSADGVSSLLFLKLPTVPRTTRSSHFCKFYGFLTGTRGPMLPHTFAVKYPPHQSRSHHTPVATNAPTHQQQSFGNVAIRAGGGDQDPLHEPQPHIG